ncbi:hypothetical protein [Pseudomonas sp. NPDC089406]|uniref:hypothetical protein n=1 Tax=Pseudomonas sp. NPDC089406 TaxID=3364463 RepID=UPI00384FD08F
MFDDFTDFKNGQWNGWEPEAQRKLHIVPTPSGYHLELPRQKVAGKQKLVSKTMHGLRPGSRYLARIQVREREDVGSGTQHIGFAIDGGEVAQWHLVQGHGWQQYSLAFTATGEAHEVSLCFEHVPGEGVAGGDFCLDDLRLTTYGDGDGDDFIDFTDFEHADEPFNGWARDAHGQGLSVIQAADGPHFLGHAAPLQDGALGPVLSKAIDWSGRFRRCSFSLRARKAGFASGSDPQIALQYNGRELAGQSIVSEQWSTLRWSFEAHGIADVSLLVFEGAGTAAGLWIDSLLVSELYEEVTDFSGTGAEEQFNGWELDSRTSDRVVVVHDSAAEGNALNFPTHPGFKHDGIILFKTFAGLLAGARFEFIMRVRSNNNINNARLSATFDEDLVMGEAVIRNLQWQPRDEEPRYKGQFTVSGGPQVLRIHNSNPASRGNDYRFSELIVRRIDLDEA